MSNIRNVIFDLDGTLALCDHRRHHVETEPIARLFRFYRDSPLHRVWILSGRSGTVETEMKTLNWLYNNNLYPTLSGSDNLRVSLRQYGDRRPDVEVKLEMIRQHGLTPENTEIVFDDRNCMVNAWRLWGFQCCQVAEGDF